MPRLTNQQIADALKATCGLVFLAAEKLGCDSEKLRGRIERNPRLLAIVKSSRGRMVDTAEAVLHRGIIERESWAVRFALTSLGEDRGYGSKDESGKLREQSLLEKRRTDAIPQLLTKALENKDFLDYCRSKHRVPSPAENHSDPREPEPNAANEPPL